MSKSSIVTFLLESVPSLIFIFFSSPFNDQFCHWGLSDHHWWTGKRDFHLWWIWLGLGHLGVHCHTPEVLLLVCYSLPWADRFSTASVDREQLTCHCADHRQHSHHALQGQTRSATLIVWGLKLGVVYMVIINIKVKNAHLLTKASFRLWLQRAFSG